MRWPKHRVVFRHLPYKVEKGHKKGKWKQMWGQVDLDTKVIEINLLKDTPPIRTYIHELAHLKYPDWNEKDIMAWERKTWKEMSLKKRLAMYRKLFS